ncbi:MAG: glycosyltransferase family 92 protein, partial [Nitrospinae bacterium]|nr:glycosyltransferase family 92 protein [Nitrospinota bacterium]
KERPRVEVRRWHRKYPDSFLISQLDWLNEAWKESRGCADWVIMVDIDEHLFAPQSSMRDLLERYNSESITLAPALGFQILSEDFPEADEHLVHSRTWGTPWRDECKLSIFNPNAIEETNFSTGRHTAKAVGRLKLPRRDELLLFHYKFLDFERTFEKQNFQYTNLGAHDIAIMYHYGWSRQELRDCWDNLLKLSGDMSWPNYNQDRYPYSHRWWRLFGILCFVSRWFKRFKKFIRNPGHMINRLKEYIIHRKIRLFIKEIYRSPIRKEMYQLIMKEKDNGKRGDTIVASKGKDGRGVLIHYQYSIDVNRLQDDKGIQNVVSLKGEYEEKYQKEFDLFVITNSRGFAKNAVEFAKNKKVKLVSRKDLIEFISQVKVS